MNSVLIEETAMNQRRSFAVMGNHIGSYGGFLMKAPNSAPPPYISSLSQFVHSTGNFGSYGSRPPPYSSLPSLNPTAAAAPPLSHQQPPLLPLPFSKSATFPPPSKKIAIPTAAVSTVRPRQNQKKKKKNVLSRPSSAPKKDPSPLEIHQKPVEKTVLAVEKKGEEGKEEFVMGSVYSLSPPPSSLPLPRFSLTKPKAAAVAASSCNAEAVVVDAGATDDLRRLLRL